MQVKLSDGDSRKRCFVRYLRFSLRYLYSTYVSESGLVSKYRHVNYQVITRTISKEISLPSINGYLY